MPLDVPIVIRLWLLSLAAFLIIATLAVAWQSTSSTRTAVVAHRGASAQAPENTLAAIDTAIDAGADYVEFDVRLTADGVPVLLHDASLARTTDVEAQLPGGQPWDVAATTLADVQKLDAGSWKGGHFADERVPTLEEALAAVGARAGALIELKTAGNPAALAAAVASELTTNGAPDGTLSEDVRVIVQSFDDAALTEFELLQPDVATSLVVADAVSAQQLRALATAREGITPNVDALDENSVRAAQDAGLAVRPYTVNDSQTMRRLIEWGVDGIITDRPERLRRILDDRS